jgi:plastocyanin
MSIAAVFVLAACGDDDDNGNGSDGTSVQSTTADTGGESTAEAAIVISGNAFTVNPATAGTITVRNEDSTAHTVTADDGSFDVTIEANSTAEFEVATAGTYAFHCNIHPSMTGELVVS